MNNTNASGTFDKQFLLKELGKLNYERLFELVAVLRRRYYRMDVCGG